MKKLLLSAVLASALVSPLPSLASFKDAVKNYEVGNFQKALAEFQSLAEIGNKDAQYNLGFMYLDGLGTKQDLAKAYAWIKLSDEDGKKAETQDVLKQIEEHLKGENKNIAIKAYEALYMSYGQSKIESDLMPNFDPEANGKAKYTAKPLKTSPGKYPQQALLNGIEGYVNIEFNLDQEGRPIDINVLDSYPPKVFDRESILAIKRWKFELPEEKLKNPMMYSMKYQIDGGVRYSEKVVNLVKKIEKEANEGDSVSQYYYAKYGPTILNDNTINASKWYFKAAQQGIADAQHEVGINLLHGQGCKVDKQKGLKWLTKAASGNLGRSQFKLSQLYSKMDDKGSQEKSEFWLDKALESGDKEIALRLARFLSKRNQPVDVISQLGLLEEKQVSNLLEYYQLYATSYADLANFEQAVNYQKKANKIMRRYGKVPVKMRKMLASYKEQLKES